MRKLAISLLFLSSSLTALETTEGDAIIVVEELVFHDHMYLYFNRQCVLHDPDCWCQIPLPAEECPFHSYLD